MVQLLSLIVIVDIESLKNQMKKVTHGDRFTYVNVEKTQSLGLLYISTILAVNVNEQDKSI